MPPVSSLFRLSHPHTGPASSSAGTKTTPAFSRASCSCPSVSALVPCPLSNRLTVLGETRKVPLSIIEVQSGCYLGEDDIVRMDARYGRIEEKPLS